MSGLEGLSGAGMEGLSGAALLMARIRECTASNHDGRVRCRGCEDDVQVLRKRYGLNPDGSATRGG